MSTKTDITNSINTIDDGGLNTASEVRATLNTLKDNAYGSVITELVSTGSEVLNNTTKDLSTKYYSLSYVKQGRLVSLNGNLTNKTGSILSSSTWFTFNSGEFLPASTPCEFIGTTSTGSDVLCKIIGNTFTVVGSIGNNQTIYFNTNYFTQD